MKIDDLNNRFGFRSMQTAAHIMTYLTREGLSQADFIQWVEKKVQDMRNMRMESKKNMQELWMQLRYQARRCPDCGKPMNLTPVNDTPRNQVDGGYLCAWQCIDLMNCGYEIYSVKNIDEEIQSYSAELSALRKRLRNATKARR